jgi:hypothetical protein
MIKIEITFEHYLNAIISELKKRLSTDCNIRLERSDCFGSIRQFAKEYSEFSHIRLDWNNWHYMFDTLEIEKDYIHAHSINSVVDMIIEKIKSEFIKQIIK